MYRGGELDRISNETRASLAGPGAVAALTGRATVAGLATALNLLADVCGSIASTVLREQQLCVQPGAAVMPVIWQSGGMPLNVIGHPGAQDEANLAAQYRLERTGCVARRPMTKIAANGISRFMYSFDCTGKNWLTDVRGITVGSCRFFIRVSCATSLPSAPQSVPACLLCA